MKTKKEFLKILTNAMELNKNGKELEAYNYLKENFYNESPKSFKNFIDEEELNNYIKNKNAKEVYEILKPIKEIEQPIFYIRCTDDLRNITSDDISYLIVDLEIYADKKYDDED